MRLLNVTVSVTSMNKILLVQIKLSPRWSSPISDLAHASSQFVTNQDPLITSLVYGSKSIQFYKHRFHLLNYYSSVLSSSLFAGVDPGLRWLYLCYAVTVIPSLG